MSLSMTRSTQTAVTAINGQATADGTATMPAVVVGAIGRSAGIIVHQRHFACGRMARTAGTVESSTWASTLTSPLTVVTVVVTSPTWPPTTAVMPEPNSVNAAVRCTPCRHQTPASWP